VLDENGFIQYVPRDDDLISKMNLLAKAVEVDEPPVLGVDLNKEDEVKKHSGITCNSRIGY
jgi:hypothetical protein